MTQNDYDKWTHFNVRCEWSLRDAAEELAKKSGLSLAGWIRVAMKEKIERDSRANPSVDSENLQRMVDASVKKALSELGLSAGMVHGLTFAESQAAGFEKTKLCARVKY